MPKNEKPRILILYDYFSPAARAGGIVRSLTYLVRNFSGSFDFYIICNHNDLGVKEKLAGINSDVWQDYEEHARVLYANPKYLSLRRMMKEIKKVQPDCIYLNGIYSLRFVLYPLLIKRFYLSVPLVVAPRGMLQAGALAVKPLKKSVYLKALKLSGLSKRVRWHATDQQEMQDIRKSMNTDAVRLAYDTPDLQQLPLQGVEKKPGTLRLVTISLITAKKNLLFLVDLIRTLNVPLQYDIYGPLKDQGYWQQCLRSIELLPGHIEVNYRGTLAPDQVGGTLRKYHFFVLPTLGENFGHAIYEALNAGRPVLLSHYTPWQGLEADGAGWNLPLQDKDWRICLKKCAGMSQVIFDQTCENAQKVAQRYVLAHDFSRQYTQLFTKENTL